MAVVNSGGSGGSGCTVSDEIAPYAGAFDIPIINLIPLDSPSS